MKLLLTFAFLGFAGFALAQQPATPTPAKQLIDQKDLQRRFGQVATRAIANFRSADSIEANLRERGQTLHPQLAALKLRIESALDEAQADLDKGDFAAANETLDRAQGLLDRLAQRLGGS